MGTEGLDRALDMVIAEHERDWLTARQTNAVSKAGFKSGTFRAS